MTAVYWLYAGVALMLIEVMTPGLVSLFFGLAALTLALIVWLAPELAQGWQWILFSVLSVLYIVLLRKSLKSVFSGAREISDNPDDALTGKLAVVTQSIAPTGRAAWSWAARRGTPRPNASWPPAPRSG